VTNAQITDALEEELEEAKEKMYADIELTQLGLAVNIIHHEFNSTVNSLRSGIRDLKRWADIDSKIDTTYKNIRSNFEHLDSYLSLLTPFNRRLYRREEVIRCEEIYVFLQDVFKGRIDRHDIQLSRTKGFSQSRINGYRSIFYPVFVNVVDNAIHWLKTKNDGEPRLVRLHAADDGTLYISNNGPQIPVNDHEKIFELGFSRKAGGRGMGLQISKEVLRNAGYDISLTEPRKDMTVTFAIKPLK
jgi:signal transduction histidine kinase